MKLNIVSILALLASSGTVAPALASLSDARVLKLTERQEMAALSQIQVEGPLTCSLGESNTGRSCELSIRDQKTGRTFGLNNDNTAMRLYIQGARTVLIEGKLENANTIAVAKASAL